MQPVVPKLIRECVVDSARRLGLALDALEWPSSGKNASPSELNALIGFQCAAMRSDPGFHFYSEGTMIDRGRIDLMGSNGHLHLAIEAKRLNDLSASAERVNSDLLFLGNFRPSCHLPKPHVPSNWWGAPTGERWGLLLITSFLGNSVREAWEAADADAARAIIQNRKRWRNFEPFISLRESPGLMRFSAPITLPDRWKHESEGWVLAGAVPL